MGKHFLGRELGGCLEVLLLEGRSRNGTKQVKERPLEDALP